MRTLVEPIRSRLGQWARPTLPPPPPPMVRRGAAQVPTPTRTQSPSLAPAPADDSADTAGFGGWLIIAVFFGLAGTWSLFAPLNGAVIAEGVVKVDGSRKAIQHLEGGIVRRLLVKEGDAVRAGQPLIELDDTEHAAGFEVLDDTAIALKLSEARLEAEQTDAKTFQLPRSLAARLREPRVTEAWRAQTALFEARRREHIEESAIVDERMGQLATQIQGSKAQLAGLQSQQVSMQEELATLRPLLDKGIVTRQRLLQLERTLASLSGQIGEATASIAKAEQAISEQRRLGVQSRNQRATAVAQELRDVRMRLAEVLPKLASARVVRDRTVVRAPYKGTVVGLAVFANGAVVGRGERLMDILPDGDELIVEARIGINDVTDVAKGATAEVHLTGYSQKTTSALAGEVVHVSADRLVDSRTNAPYFTVTIKLDGSGLERLGRERLLAGMGASVTIPTTARTAIEYLIEPLRASFSRALRER
ncbi:MAG: HlyD family type I secretion periplasmic adaptor subunit [Hyphomicrobiaceae bacterium]